jgi:anti-sigma factor RsiW
MNCRHARGLFGAYWDDEITQAEREWLESHFARCEPCRRGYEEFSRPLEALAALPRVEPEAGLPERVLARVRRASSAPDRLPVGTPAWVPLTAAAALLLLAAPLLMPLLGVRGSGPIATNRARTEVVREPILLAPAGRHAAPANPSPSGLAASLAADSLFDHSADVEFVLDPVTLHRGQATLSRQGSATQGDRTVVSF